MAWQAMTRVYVAPVPVQPFESVTVTTMGNVPGCVGVPERRPLLDSVRPPGRVDAVEKVTAPMPPLCVNCSLNAASTVPLLFAGLLTVMVWQPMTSVYVAPLPVQPFESVTVTTI